MSRLSPKMDGAREDQAWGKKGTSERADKECKIHHNELSLRERKKRKMKSSNKYSPQSQRSYR